MYLLLQFELTSIPWGENSTPLVATLQSMVKSILDQNEMKDPSANEHRKLSVEQRIDQMKVKLDGKTKYELEKYLLHDSTIIKYHRKIYIVQTLFE